MKCEVCEFETDNPLKLAGHHSGHVRRGVLPKRTWVRASDKTGLNHTCLVCGKQCKSGQALGGHLQTHIEFSRRTDDRSRKREIIREDGHKCQICGGQTWMGQPIPLTLDHIDGNCENSERSNLRVICPNCHAQTPTFAGRNRGSFQNTSRKGRVKYYLTAAMRQKLNNGTK